MTGNKSTYWHIVKFITCPGEPYPPTHKLPASKSDSGLRTEALDSRQTVLALPGCPAIQYASVPAPALFPGAKGNNSQHGGASDGQVQQALSL